MYSERTGSLGVSLAPLSLSLSPLFLSVHLIFSPAPFLAALKLKREVILRLSRAKLKAQGPPRRSRDKPRRQLSACLV